jgi:hypothetical protein
MIRVIHYALAKLREQQPDWLALRFSYGKVSIVPALEHILALCYATSVVSQTYIRVIHWATWCESCDDILQHTLNIKGRASYMV